MGSVWVAGSFTDIGLTGVRDLEVPIQRRFRSVAGMCKAALNGGGELVLLMSEHQFHAHRSDGRLRAVVDDRRRFEVVVLHGWLSRPSG